MAIPFIRDFNFDYGVVDQISPRVQRVIADNPGPFTYTGTGVYIIGDQNVAVIDPGPITEAHSIALDKAIQGRSVTHVLLTHHHSDHSPLAASLAKKHGCKVYGQSLKKRDGLINDAGFEAGKPFTHRDILLITCVLLCLKKTSCSLAIILWDGRPVLLVHPMATWEIISTV